MRRYFIFLLVILSGILAAAACEQVPDPEPDPYPNGQVIRDLTIESTAMSRTMKYSLWLPQKFDGQKAYPILYLLHGAGDNQNGWLDKGNAMSIAARFVNEGGMPMIIVMPDAMLTFYQGDFETYFYEELMPTVEKQYKFSGKRAVAGLSMGGYGTLYYGLKYPQKFTYGYAMSPATAEWFASLIDLQSDKKVFPLFTIEVGMQDATVDNEATRVLAQTMQEKGLSCEWIERVGTHNWSFWQACLPKAMQKAAESFK